MFSDAENGWAVGSEGTIVSTTNGGVQWFPQAGTLKALTDVHFVDPLRGWACGSQGTYIRTTTGGIAWLSLPNAPTGNLYGMKFLDQDIGWVVGERNQLATIHRTTNGGGTWTEQNSMVGNRLTAVDFVDPDSGWAVGFGGRILHTADGGTNWISQRSGGAELNDVDFVNGSTGWSVGDDILHTTDAGLTWETQSMGNVFHDIEAIDENEVWVVGGGNNGEIHHTTDGGLTWTENVFQSTNVLYSVCFVNEQTGWVLGVADSGSEHRVFRTTDGGSVWEQTADVLLGFGFRIFFFSEIAGWISGSDGIILKTTDGGLSWVQQWSGTTEYWLYDIQFVSDSVGWVVGALGAPIFGPILRTTNGGGVVGVGDVGAAIPIMSQLVQNYPNPFNPSTTITFSIPKSGEVSLRIFNLLGEEVARLVSGHRDAGTHAVQWDATGQPSGVYFYRLLTNDFVQTRKLVLVR